MFRDMMKLFRRINGVSTPLVGVQWAYQESDRSAALRVMRVLADRRVLQGCRFECTAFQEQRRRSIESVLSMRQFFTAELGNAETVSDGLARILEVMRNACTAFLDGTERLPIIIVPDGQPTLDFCKLVQALRDEIGSALGQISKIYKIEIDCRLNAIVEGKNRLF